MPHSVIKSEVLPALVWTVYSVARWPTFASTSSCAVTTNWLGSTPIAVDGEAVGLVHFEASVSSLQDAVRATAVAPGASELAADVRAGRVRLDAVAPLDVAG